MEKTLTYEAAFAELKQITEEIESEDVSVDHLSEKVKRASFLIRFCQEKLHSAETEVTAVIASMEKENSELSEDQQSTTDFSTKTSETPS